MKIVFFGTPEYVVPIIKALDKVHKIIMVVTQPPRPVGRDKKIDYSAVDTWAHKRKIPISFTFDDIPEADLGVVASYGKIIPQDVISRFTYGILNVHPSLLPKYRGASPVQSAIAAGEIRTGLTIIKMDKQMDHGPIVSQFKEDILPTDTTPTLRDRLFARAAKFLVDLIPFYISEKIKPKPQDDKSATFTKMIKKEDGFVDLTKENGKAQENFIRAMSPWPGAWTFVKIGDKKLRLKILGAHLEENKLVLDEVQLEGKNPVKWTQFESAYGSQSFQSS